MRTISPDIQIILDFVENISYFYLVTIGPFSGTIIRDTSITGGITMSGDVFSGDNGLLYVDPPRMSSTVDKETYKISYADPSFIWRTRFESGFSGVPIIIRVGFFNTWTSTLNNTPVGYPFNTYTDTITVYSGFSDMASYSINMEGEASMTLECSSPMGSLSLSRSLLTTDDNMRQRYPNDNSFEQVFLGSKGVDVLWGKKTS